MENALKRKENWLYPTLFVALMALLLVNITAYYNFCDENDNFMAGISIVAGQNIFVDYTSQHMPLLYYICAVFKLLGAQNAFQFRLYFYVFFAFLWVLFYARNQKEFGKLASAAVPVLYVCNMYTYYTSCVLSDHLQAYGMAVLLFEFCSFCKTRRVDWPRILWVAAAIVLSFGVAFVSAFGIAAIVFGVLMLEILDARKKKLKIGETALAIVNRYKWLFLIAVAPFVLYVLVYAFQGYLDELFFGAFQMNTEIYPQYTGGYGSSVLGAFTEPFYTYFWNLQYNIFHFAELTTWADRFDAAKIFACYLVNAAFLVSWWKRSKVEAILLFFFLVLSGSRGFGFEFHCVPYYAVTLGMLGMLLQKAWRGEGRKLLLKGITVAAALFMMVPYVKTLERIPNVAVEWGARNSMSESSYEYYVQRLTEPGEEFFLSTIDFYIAVNADRTMMGSAVSTPWTYLGYQEATLESLETQMPRVAIYNEDYNVWGYYLKDYAPEIIEFMDKNYRPMNLPNCPYLYVRNDYYGEAVEKSGYPYIIEHLCSPNGNLLFQFMDTQIAQTMIGGGETIDCFGVVAGTYARNNNSKVMLEILDGVSGEVLVSETVSVFDWVDNTYNYISFEDIVLEEGKEYIVELTPVDAIDGNYIAIYYAQDGSEDTNAVVGGEEQTQDICYGLFQSIE